MFLAELPVPLIPFELYTDFLNVAGGTDSIENGSVTSILERLPLHRKRLLIRLLTYLKNHIDSSQVDSQVIDKIADLFSIVIMRPRDEDSKLIAFNLQRQRNVVKCLIGTMPMAVPNSQTSPATPSTGEGDRLKKAEWYWGAIAKHQVNELLNGAPDGSFLVRDSASPGEYTITLKKDGTNKLIRIIHREGKYGFLDNPPFHSVCDLIDHFRTHSLEAHNPDLKTKLMYPISKNKEYADVQRNLANFKKLEVDLAQASQEFTDLKVWSEAQMEITYMLEEQIKLTEGCLSEVPSQEKPVLEESIRHMRERLKGEKEELQSFDEKFKEVGAWQAYLSDRVTTLKPYVPGWQRLYDDLLKKVESPNNEEAEPPVVEAEEVRYDALPALNQGSNNELPTWAWMMGNLDREQAKKLLEGRPDGTFLVRTRGGTNQNTYAISLVYNNSVKHIAIEQGPNGYGFSEPYNRYRTLESLIIHYHKQSLRMHNPALDTTLIFPIRFVEDNEDVYVRL